MNTPESIREKIETSQMFEQNGDIGQAFQQARQALEMAVSTGQPEAIATAQMSLARVHFRLGHDREAYSLASQALQGLDTAEPVRVDALLMLGMCGEGVNYIDSRETYYHQAIDLSRQLGYFGGLVRGLHNLSAGVYLIRGQFELAQAADEEALRLAREHDMFSYAPWPLITLSWIDWLTGRSDQARTIMVELDRLTSPESLGKGYFYVINANLALDSRDWPAAHTFYTCARGIAETLGAPDLGVYTRLGLCRLALANGDPNTAFTWADDALGLAKRVDYPFLCSEALIERGRATFSGRKNPAAAEEDFRRALELLTPLGASFEQARAGLFLAAVLHQEKQNGAVDAWIRSVSQIQQGGYDFLVHQERALIYPLLAEYLGVPALGEACADLLVLMARFPPQPLKLTLFGGLRVWRGAEPIPGEALHKRRAGELLAFLALCSHHVSNIDQVVEALCPGADISSSQSILHHATSCLRQALEPELPPKLPSRYLLVENGQVTLLLPEGSLLDVEEFSNLVKHEAWSAAAASFGGELLPDYYYSDWLSAWRLQFSQMGLIALVALASQRLVEGAYSEVLTSYRQIHRLEPWHEQAALLAMQACVALDDCTGALRIYRDLKNILDKDLGITPGQELQSLAKDISKMRGNKPGKPSFRK